jgi:hypothetical protein
MTCIVGVTYLWWLVPVNQSKRMGGTGLGAASTSALLSFGGGGKSKCSETHAVAAAACAFEANTRESVMIRIQGPHASAISSLLAAYNGPASPGQG